MTASPIRHIVVLCMENRSFDHFLGALALEDPSRGIDGLKSQPFDVPDGHGGTVTSWQMDDKSAPIDAHSVIDVPHGWDNAHADWNNGANDGFVQSFEAVHKNDPKIKRIPMGYYTRESLGVLYSLADNFVVCDHWHASLLSSTWPNRKYLHSGTRDDDRDTQCVPGLLGFRTTPIYEAIANHADPESGEPLTWRSYFCDMPFLAFWYGFAMRNLRNFETIDAFARDCIQGTLPTISIIDPPFSLADDHPPHDPVVGEKFIGLIVDALTNSISWQDSAMVLLYDEFGGFYDHLAPPPAPEPSTTDTPLGFRVPAIVVSPYAKAKYVSHQTYDHTSVIASIAARWQIPFGASFGSRWNLVPTIWDDCFDFGQEARQMGTYTGTPVDVTWARSVRERLATPIGEFQSALQRIFVLPELTALDRRSQMYDTLGRFEGAVIGLKRSTDYATQ